MLIVILVLLLSLINVNSLIYATESADISAQIKDTVSNETIQADVRVDKLNRYLKSQASPLSGYANLIVSAADKYDLPDWRLVPAISGVESTFGKYIPTDSYNAWGWANGNFYFHGWDEAIDTVTKTIKEKYVLKGFDTPEKMSRIYAPPSTTWAQKVKFFMINLDQYHLRFPKDLQLSI